MENPKVVVIGAGHAAGAFAEFLRKEGHEGEILIIGKEEHAPYQRPPLSKQFLAGKIDQQRLFLRPSSFYEKKNINFMLSSEVVGLKPSTQCLKTARSEEIDYDKLVIATGTRVRKLAVPGENLNGVHYIRTLKDVSGLQDDWEEAHNIVIIGGGFIGLEAAAIASAFGKKVTILEMQNRVMPRVVAPELSDYYQNYHRENGVDIECNKQVNEINGVAGRVKNVKCSDGKTYKADLVIVGIGVIPNTEIASMSGLAVNDGILIDENCKTSDDNIYSIGECTRFDEPRYGSVRLESVQNAQDQAKTAALAITGKSQPHNVVPWFWSEQYDLRLQMAGISDGYDEIILRGDTESKKFSYLYFKEGKLIAVDSVNSAGDHMAARKLLGEGISPDKKKSQDTSIKLKDFLTSL